MNHVIYIVPYPRPMKEARTEKTIEVIDKHINKAAEVIPDEKKRPIRSSESRDAKIAKYFPLFVVGCVVIWIISVVVSGSYTLQSIIKILCVIFILGFTAIGIPLFALMNQGVFPKWALAVHAAFLSFLVVLFGNFTAHEYVSHVFRDALRDIGINLSGEVLIVVVWAALTAIILFSITGVMYVVAVYLKKFFPGVFLSLYIHSKEGVRAGSEKFFAIPDIIDVKDVIVDPSIDRGRFNTRVGLRLGFYTILAGFLASSYLFLNPVFLESMTTADMVGIMIMLSIFLPTLIIPWQIVADLNARVVSDAPRDYYLWNGAKKTLMGFFLALGVFLTMFLIALSYGYSLQSMLVNYVYFLVPLLCVSQMYSLVYANNYVEDMKEHIATMFQQGKDAEDKKS